MGPRPILAKLAGCPQVQGLQSAFPSSHLSPLGESLYTLLGGGKERAFAVIVSMLLCLNARFSVQC